MEEDEAAEFHEQSLHKLVLLVVDCSQLVLTAKSTPLPWVFEFQDSSRV